MSNHQLRHLENLHAKHLLRLRLLEEKAAIYGLNTPPEVFIEIDNIRAQLVQLEQKIEHERADHER